MVSVKIEPSWGEALGGEFAKPYFEQLTTAVKQEYRHNVCYPPGQLIFNAFNLCPFDKVRVVIIGQDPYHEEGQAMGLSFSVPKGIQMPPSLITSSRRFTTTWANRCLPTATSHAGPARECCC